MVNFIKKRKITILAIVSLLSIIFIAYLIKNDSPIFIKTTPTTKPISTFQNLILGEADRNKTVKEIGIPQKEYIENNKLYLEYLTTNPNYNDQFIFENNKLILIKKIITIKDTIRVSDMDNKYGLTNHVMYGPASSIGLYLYIYPEKGIAYLGHRTSGYLNEIWYFEPTDIKNFKSRFALNYSETLDPIQ